MGIRLAGLALVLGLLMVSGVMFGFNGTAEATIDPIQSGECQSDAGEDAVDAGRPDFEGLVGPNNVSHPPGLSDPEKNSCLAPIINGFGTSQGETGADGDHCPNP